MANVTINGINTQANTLTDEALFIIYDDNTTQKMPASVLKDYLSLSDINNTLQGLEERISALEGNNS